MREAAALIRAAWLTASSYRFGMVLSIIGLAAVVVPLYFITGALQPTMASAIASESSQYFAFAVLGAVAFSLVSTSMTALPNAIDGAIGRGTLEVILGTPARLPAVCVGMMGYNVLWALFRAAILVAAAAVLGTRIVWSGALPGVGVLLLTMLCYAGFGFAVAALVLVFRTAGPMSGAFLTASMFLGGVYYPSHVIPSWIRALADVVPLTYGLRAFRHVALRGDFGADVLRDVETLAAMTLVALSLGIGSFVLALGRARRTGTLSSY